MSESEIRPRKVSVWKSGPGELTFEVEGERKFSIGAGGIVQFTLYDATGNMSAKFTVETIEGAGLYDEVSIG